MKRANGTGSIVKLPGNRRRPYAVKVSGRNEYGHVIQRTLSYHAKAAEAQQALEEYRKKEAEGVLWADTALMLCYTGFRVSEFLSLTRFSYHPEDGGYLQGGIKNRSGEKQDRPRTPKNQGIPPTIRTKR